MSFSGFFKRFFSSYQDVSESDTSSQYGVKVTVPWRGGVGSGNYFEGKIGIGGDDSWHKMGELSQERENFNVLGQKSSVQLDCMDRDPLSFYWWSRKAYDLGKQKDSVDAERELMKVGQKLLETAPFAYQEAEVRHTRMLEDNNVMGYEADPANVKSRAYNAVWRNQGVPAYIRLLLRRGDFQKVVDVCGVMIEHDIRDTTKGGFEGRRRSAINKIEKLN